MTPDKISKEIEAKFGNQFRTRVNGLLIREEKILMVKHLMGNGKILWSVPGGGMHFGQNAKENLKREFKEECGLEVEVGDFQFVHEFLQPPLHAIELFFEIKSYSGNPVLGFDPELHEENQILSDIAWMNIESIRSLPKESLHHVFWGIKSLQDIGLWKGYFNFENISIK
ncbi:NUDIX domain-containing protein [Algoriphagus sp. CAU 1675]|uniref:NUDIX domain-containing protein n=1 Tax=Algoriphagus sp. CAU 1675 TaxID=3032597 RepID=UPI0023DCCEA7|nr:NUDIX domain-containing protein [Algoriphagus sp. CAU 1675]MDF2158521.1 NUDIX domain-containing protein [Algoriphagus sp. CAU 1675]